MVEEVMHEVRNFFEREYYAGVFHVSNGCVRLGENCIWGGLEALERGRWIAIQGSHGLDGVYGPEDALPSASSDWFDGRVWVLYPPRAFLKLCGQIEAYCDAQSNAPTYIRESFGSYSYQRSAEEQNRYLAPWNKAFAAQLAPWRRMISEVPRC